MSHDSQRIVAETPCLDGRVRMLWHAGYWDGPLSGFVTLDGVDGFWVTCIEDFWNERPGRADESCLRECGEYAGDRECCMKESDRLYVVYELDTEQVRIASENHELFRKHVGTHTDYSDEPGVVHPREHWARFYDADKRTMPAPRAEQIVGHTIDLFSNEEARDGE